MDTSSFNGHNMQAGVITKQDSSFYLKGIELLIDWLTMSVHVQQSLEGQMRKSYP